MNINRRIGSLAALVLAMTLSQTASAVVGSATGIPQNSCWYTEVTPDASTYVIEFP